MDEERKLLPWTPGPWRIDGLTPQDSWGAQDGEDRCEIVCLPHATFNALEIYAKRARDDLAEHEANARLIAAAPEIYERVQSSSIALEEAAKLLEGHGLSGCASIMRGYIAGNNAALAKARGESNTRSGGTSDE